MGKKMFFWLKITLIIYKISALCFYSDNCLKLANLNARNSKNEIYMFYVHYPCENFINY